MERFERIRFHFSDPSMGWGQQTGGQPQPSGPGLSVVTTVWGVTQTTQSGPFSQQTPTAPGFTNTTMSTTSPYNQGQPQGTTQSVGGPYPSAQQMQKPGVYNGGQPGMGAYNRPGSAPYNNRPK